MAHMSLTLQNTFQFTHACAVDGSFLPLAAGSYNPMAVNDGLAAWAVWYGVGDDGRPAAQGGALPPGSSIADAEMTAVDACMVRAQSETPAGEAPRLLVLSDCTAVIQSVESVQAPSTSTARAHSDAARSVATPGR